MGDDGPSESVPMPEPSILSSQHIARLPEGSGDMAAVVRAAIASGRAVLAFQPVVPCLKPDHVLFYEALLRVRDEDGRLIPARNFASVLNTMPLAVEVDRAIVALGLDALRRKPYLRISLNLSGDGAADPGVRQLFDQGFDADPGLGERLIIEVGEKHARDDADLIADLAAYLRNHGAALALDDYGCGQLDEIPDLQLFDIVKIAGLNVRGLTAEPEIGEAARGLLAVAEVNGVLAIAQHVETAEDADALRALGMPCMQGFYVGLPVPFAVARMPKPAES